MTRDPLGQLAVYQKRAQRFERRWQSLCERHLPLAPAESIWRYRNVDDPGRPTQGWKLHVSATVLNACEVLERVANFLADFPVEFKAARSLNEVIKLNSGLFYGYSQVGKIITVYPRTPGEAVELAGRLYALTRRMAAPAVPFDMRFGGNIYYRFGAFAPLELEHADGRRAPAIRAPDGELVPDVRVSERAMPGWVSDPFEGRRPRARRRGAVSPLASSFRVFGALVQRGKGGVYRALDLRGPGPRPCLLKEGRRHGEKSWDGRDGARMVRHEERVISALAESGVEAPRIYSSFELAGNHYLVTEFIEGETLHDLLAKRERRMPVPLALRYGVQLSDIFRRLHAAGWVWRDCKPANILVTPEGRLRPLDFEGACPAGDPDPLFWGTPGFAPPEWGGSGVRVGASGDLYALGSMLYLLLTGRLPEAAAPLPVEGLRRGVPPNVRALVMGLLSQDPESRPSAGAAALELRAALSAREPSGGAGARATAGSAALGGALRRGADVRPERRRAGGVTRRVSAAAAREG